jgi:hypothetical protein
MSVEVIHRYNGTRDRRQQTQTAVDVIDANERM